MGRLTNSPHIKYIDMTELEALKQRINTIKKNRSLGMSPARQWACGCDLESLEEAIKQFNKAKNHEKK